ncbi:Serine/threonine-protein kinase D [Rubripirellula lacrimiformis]|uniref:Serine/threonine-protein kinase D n=1 Tax=Rubripirellula lacrimiformis TaxID=1930273 RepID=A0A517NKB7_9BACT|nr:Serine/threonine-protein kinase D [Rubripirellula lacrimiformis]
MVQPLGSGGDAKIRVLVLEALEGLSLFSRCHEKPLSNAEVFTLAKQLAGTLDAIHRAGVWHLDISPRNLFLRNTDDGSIDAVILDFGLSQQAGEYRQGAILYDGKNLEELLVGYGTQGFQSPEIKGRTRISPATDVYSLGCVLGYALTGKDDRDPEAFRKAIHTATKRSLRLRRIIFDCINGDSHKRSLRAATAEGWGRRSWVAIAACVIAISLAVTGLVNRDPARQEVATTGDGKAVMPDLEVPTEQSHAPIVNEDPSGTDQSQTEQALNAMSYTEALSVYEAVTARRDGSMLGQQIAFPILIRNGSTFSGADLSGTSLDKVDLRGADFSGAELRFCEFREADASGCNFSGADFAFANLRSLSATQSDFSGSVAPYSIAEEANFSDSSFRRSYFVGSRLSGADFSGSDLTGANFSFCDITNAKFDGAILTDCIFAGCGGGGATFAEAKVRRTNVAGAYLNDDQFTAEQRKALSARGEPLFHQPLYIKESIPSTRFDSGYIYEDIIGHPVPLAWNPSIELPGKRSGWPPTTERELLMFDTEYAVLPRMTIHRDMLISGRKTLVKERVSNLRQLLAEAADPTARLTYPGNFEDDETQQIANAMQSFRQVDAPQPAVFDFVRLLLTEDVEVPKYLVKASIDDRFKWELGGLGRAEVGESFLYEEKDASLSELASPTVNGSTRLFEGDALELGNDSRDRLEAWIQGQGSDAKQPTLIELAVHLRIYAMKDGDANVYPTSAQNDWPTADDDWEYYRPFAKRNGVSERFVPVHTHITRDGNEKTAFVYGCTLPKNFLDICKTVVPELESSSLLPANRLTVSVIGTFDSVVRYSDGMLVNLKIQKVTTVD